jgi:hypothetical protein
MPYLTRRGRLPTDPARESPPYLEAPDDGAILVCFGRSTPRCIDCDGVGTLARAKAPPSPLDPSGRLPWLHVCGRCSAHWDVESVPYYVLADDSLVLDRFGEGLDFPADLDEPVSAKTGAPTHRAIIESVSAAERTGHFERARQRFREAHQFFKGPYARVPLPACWARRGRIHPLTTSADVRVDIGAMTPESTLAYFERLSVVAPSADIWAEGAEVTREWIALIQGRGASQQRVDALLSRVRDNRTSASMFHQLQLDIARWAREAGWRVR